MYTLSDQQIGFISDDIRARGIAMVSLQQDLLDHICCIIEATFDGKDDFEGFYRKTISTFYERDLGEIEEETVRLLTFKNYYTMKKIMLGSGGVSVALMTVGIVMKFLHLPGAAMLLVLGGTVLSFLFLPLLFILKMKEKGKAIDRAILGVGMCSAMLVSLGILFKMMHWPGANIMSISALGLLLLVFLPIYFFTGIRNPERKVNTIVTSMLIVAGSGLLLMLVRRPEASRELYVAQTAAFLKSEQLLKRMRTSVPVSGNAEAVIRECDALKAYILQNHIGNASIPDDFETREILLDDSQVGDYLREKGGLVKALKTAISQYNATSTRKIDTRYTLFDTPMRRVSDALGDINSIEMEVVLNDKPVAMK